MSSPRVLARRLLRHLERFAEATNDVLLVVAIGLGGFYLSVLVILTLMPLPPADVVGRVGYFQADRAGEGFPHRPE